MSEFINLINQLNFSNIMWQIITPLIFSFADIVTGFIQAKINNDVDSKKMRTGLLHKSLIIIIIILSFVLEYAFSLKYISSFVCVYVVVMEIVSILENLKKAGVDLGKIGDALKEKADFDTTTLNNIVNKIDKVTEEKESEEE